MKISSRITSALLLIALLAVTASAEITINTFTHEAEFSSAEQVTRVCACGETTDFFVLENIGDFPASFLLTLETDADWVSLPGRQVHLQAGQSVPVEVLVTPACGTDEQEHYTVYAVSEFGRFRAADRDVTAVTCDPLAFSVRTDTPAILPCREARFTVAVENPTTYTESYRLSAEATVPVTLSERAFELAPGERRVVNATAQWACGVTGAQEVEFTAHAERSDIEKEREARVVIERDFAFDVRPVRFLNVSGVSVCAEEQTRHQVEIRNLARTDAEFEINVEPGWAQTDVQRISLDAGRTRTLNVTVSPGEDRVGAQSVDVIVRSVHGGIEQRLSFPVEVRDCYEHQIIIEPSQLAACAGPMNVSVAVENRGETTERFTLSSSGDIFSELGQDEFTLRSGERRNVVLHVEVPDRVATYEVSVSANQTPGIQTASTLTIDAVSNAACVRIEPDRTDIEIFSDAEVVPILVRNTGIRASAYDIRHEGTALSPLESELFLAAGEEAVVHLLVRNGTGAGTYIERLSFVAPRATYRYDLHVEIEDRGLWDRFREGVLFGAAGRIDWCVLVLLVLTIILVLALIALALLALGLVPRPLLKKNRRNALAIALAGAAAALVLIALFSATFVDAPERLSEEPRGSDYDALYHEFVQGEVYELDLSRYFVDPDEDDLRFSATHPEYLDVNVDGSVARIRAQSDFSGEQRIAFTAFDEQGLAADSPVMTINVIGRESLGVAGTVQAYCWPIGFLLLALILLVGIAALFVRAPRKLEKRGEEIRAIVLRRPTDAQVRQTEVVSGETRPIPAQRTSPTVMGDVVAGDKVTYVGTPKSETFITSQGGTKIHRAECPIGQRIPREKRLVYTSRADALAAGYNPCRVCRPFDE